MASKSKDIVKVNTSPIKQFLIMGIAPAHSVYLHSRGVTRKLKLPSKSPTERVTQLSGSIFHTGSPYDPEILRFDFAAEKFINLGRFSGHFAMIGDNKWITYDCSESKMVIKIWNPPADSKAEMKLPP